MESTNEVKYCARHPKVETGITCPTCGKPICPDCMVVTPVGMKCRECGLQRGGTLFQVGFGRLMLAGLVAVVAGAIAALLGEVGFLVIFIGMAYGYGAGTAIMKSAGMKRGRKMEIVTGVGMVLGALAFKLLPLLVGGAPIEVCLMSLVNPWFIVAVAVATACAVSKVRYL
jgi:hypothetical protein